MSEWTFRLPPFSKKNRGNEVDVKDGSLPLWKEKGMTSHDCVFKLRKILGMKKVGHTGTLHPTGEGVLPYVLGKRRRLRIRDGCRQRIYRHRLDWSLDETEDGDGATNWDDSFKTISRERFFKLPSPRLISSTASPICSRSAILAIPCGAARMPPTLDDNTILRLRMRAQGLVDPRAESVRDVLHRVGALQAQDLAASQLALHARAARLTISRRHARLQSGSRRRPHLADARHPPHGRRRRRALAPAAYSGPPSSPATAAVASNWD